MNRRNFIRGLLAATTLTFARFLPGAQLALQASQPGASQPGPVRYVLAVNVYDPTIGRGSVCWFTDFGNWPEIGDELVVDGKRIGPVFGYTAQLGEPFTEEQRCEVERWCSRWSDAVEFNRDGLGFVFDEYDGIADEAAP